MIHDHDHDADDCLDGMILFFPLSFRLLARDALCNMSIYLWEISNPRGVFFHPPRLSAAFDQDARDQDDFNSKMRRQEEKHQVPRP